MKRKQQPKVFVGIATGPAKDYAMHYMVAALRNLDWDNKEIHWAFTHFLNTRSDMHMQRLVALMETVPWTCKWYIHKVAMDMRKPLFHVRRTHTTKMPIFHCYDLIIRNLRRLRGIFLDGDYDYFLEVGGDNPPPRDSIRRLMRMNVDVAFGTCFQRPKDTRGSDTKKEQPLVYEYSWMLDDLERFNLDKEMVRQFWLGFANSPFVIPLHARKDWRKSRFLTRFSAGTGLVLIKRHVLERVGWHMPPSRYFSEDLYFCHQCHLHGYSMKIDLQFHVPHFHEDGLVY